MGSSSSKQPNVVPIEQKTEVSDPLKDNIFLRKVRECLIASNVKYCYDYSKSYYNIINGQVNLIDSLYRTKMIVHENYEKHKPVIGCRGLFYKDITEELKSKLNEYFKNNDDFIFENIKKVYENCMKKTLDEINVYLNRDFIYKGANVGVYYDVNQFMENYKRELNNVEDLKALDNFHRVTPKIFLENRIDMGLDNKKYYSRGDYLSNPKEKYESIKRSVFKQYEIIRQIYRIQDIINKPITDGIKLEYMRILDEIYNVVTSPENLNQLEYMCFIEILDIISEDEFVPYLLHQVNLLIEICDSKVVQDGAINAVSAIQQPVTLSKLRKLVVDVFNQFVNYVNTNTAFNLTDKQRVKLNQNNMLLTTDMERPKSELAPLDIDGGLGQSINQRIVDFAKTNQKGANDFNYKLLEFRPETVELRAKQQQGQRLVSLIHEVVNQHDQTDKVSDTYIDQELIDQVHEDLEKYCDNYKDNILYQLLETIRSRSFFSRIIGGEGQDYKNLLNAAIIVFIIICIIYIFIVYGLGHSHKVGAVVSVVGLAAMHVISKNLRCNILGGMI